MLVCDAMVRFARAGVLPPIETAMRHVIDDIYLSTPDILGTTSRLVIGIITTTYESVPHSEFPFIACSTYSSSLAPSPLNSLSHDRAIPSSCSCSIAPMTGGQMRSCWFSFPASLRCNGIQ